MFCVSEDLKGIAKIWILGDNFVAESYRKSFKKASGDFYMKNNFEVFPFCSSRFSDKNTNVLSRIVNSLVPVHALNTKFHLPEYLIIFLDNDLIEHLQYKRMNVASLLGPWLEYLMEFVGDVLQSRRQLLNLKSQLKEPTQVYFVESVSHTNFDYCDQQVREIFTKCMEASCKDNEPMHVLKLREYWEKNDDALVVNNRFTKQGLLHYWKSMDASFQFNVKKREEFITCHKLRILKMKSEAKETGQSMKSDHEDREEIPRFFARHQRQDRFHWHNKASDRGTRFMLPTPKF